MPRETPQSGNREADHAMKPGRTSYLVAGLIRNPMAGMVGIDRQDLRFMVN